MKKNNKKTKENPIMVEQKKLKNIKINDFAEDGNEIKSFIIIVVIIAILIGIIYGLTELLKSDEKPDKDEIVAGVIDYEKVSVGTILNRPYDEYYVMLYNSEDKNAVVYSTILTKYMQNSTNKDYIKIYYCDLNNTLNKKYYNVNDDNISNPDAEKIEDFDFGELTLLKIKKDKIVEYTEDFKKIKDILK